MEKTDEQKNVCDKKFIEQCAKTLAYDLLRYSKNGGDMENITAAKVYEFLEGLNKRSIYDMERKTPTNFADNDIFKNCTRVFVKGLLQYYKNGGDMENLVKNLTVVNVCKFLEDLNKKQ